MRAPRGLEVDEEVLADGIPAAERRARGAWFTPAALVQQVIAQVRPQLSGTPTRIVDPACGAGAFLTACEAAFPEASLFGLELSDVSAAQARARVPRARVTVGDALRGDVEALLGPPDDGFELWIGNPPYNGTSSVLRDPAAYARLRALLPAQFELPSGTSLRDDYAFFLLLAAQRLSVQRGALAFVTSATLLDAYLYAPLRRFLLERLSLREVLALPDGTFDSVRARTCVTIWTSKESAASPRFRVCAAKQEGFTPAAPQPLSPGAPDWLLRPVDREAAELDRFWRERGEELTSLVPVSFPGLKTRFDELLVDDDPDRLHARVDAFLRCAPGSLEAFARAHALPNRTWAKLTALKAALPEGHRVRTEAIRLFFRYAGARHRGSIPSSAKAYCYLDRALIPRGDHRLRGEYDPHRGAVKLLFNVRELPLSAALLEEEGCVHDHRHARFAPLLVPERILREGLSSARSGDFGAFVPNLSSRGVELAERVGGPLALFRQLVAFINGDAVQRLWAPAFGALRALPIPDDLARWI